MDTRPILAFYMFLMFDLVKTGTAMAGALIVILTIVDKVEFIFNR